MNRQKMHIPKSSPPNLRFIIVGAINLGQQHLSLKGRRTRARFEHESFSKPPPTERPLDGQTGSKGSFTSNKDSQLKDVVSYKYIYKCMYVRTEYHINEKQVTLFW